MCEEIKKLKKKKKMLKLINLGSGQTRIRTQVCVTAEPILLPHFLKENKLHTGI